MTSHSVNNETGMGLVISLCSNSNRLISLIPQTASNFRHLLSCGTIVILSNSQPSNQFLHIEKNNNKNLKYQYKTNIYIYIK